MSAPSRPTCRVVRSTETYQGKQQTSYAAAISAESVGARELCMHTLSIPPGARAKAHLHENHETSIYVLSGEAGMWYGDQLQEHLTVKAGDLLYIPAGMPHLPYNPNDTEPAVGIVARIDPNEQESVLLLPELDKIHDG
jgi:uncharacterized RmlC-like cupin family protein